ncbi:hypothetical protein BDZ91DRAFT_725816, partial [Kalaharituber pfeilii]
MAVVATWCVCLMAREVDNWLGDMRRWAMWWWKEVMDANRVCVQQHEGGGGRDVDADADGDGDNWGVGCVGGAESTGEVFLRKAGMNVFAAGAVLKVVERVCESEGRRDGIMRRVLMMHREQKLMEAVRGIVGWRAVRRMCVMLGGEWG